MGKRWTPDETAILHEHYPRMPRKELEAILTGRNWTAIQQRGETLGIRRAAERARWTPEQTRILKVAYADGARVDELAKALGHSPSAIRTAASRLTTKRIRRQVPVTADRLNPAALLAHLTEAERGYIAGFLDGEGCITISRTKRTGPIGFAWSLKVSITNTDPRPIEWLIENISGSSLYIGKERPRRLTPYTWRLWGSAAVRFCGEIAPYLMVKKAEAELVAEQLSAGFAPLSVTQRNDLWRQLHTLKTKGKKPVISPT